MSKYFGFKNKQDMIDDIKEGEIWISYKDDSTYVFTLDGHGYNLLNDKLYGEFTTSEHQEKNRYSAETVEELIEIAVLHDGIRLADAIEMDL